MNPIVLNDMMSNEWLMGQIDDDNDTKEGKMSCFFL